MSFLNNLFGSNAPAPLLPNGGSGFKYVDPVGISGGGISGGYSPTTNTYSVGVDPSRTAYVNGAASTYGGLAERFSALNDTITPGFNGLLQARLEANDANYRRAIGDLTQNLANRRIQGSSFGQSAYNRAKIDYWNSQDQIRSDNYLKSLAASQELTLNEFNTRKQQFQTGLDELNLETGLANTLSVAGGNQLAQNAQNYNNVLATTNIANAKNAQDTASGVGSFLGKIGTAAFTTLF